MRRRNFKQAWSEELVGLIFLICLVWMNHIIAWERAREEPMMNTEKVLKQLIVKEFSSATHKVTFVSTSIQACGKI